jgi:hypothetical protein
MEMLILKLVIMSKYKLHVLYLFEAKNYFKHEFQDNIFILTSIGLAKFILFIDLKMFANFFFASFSSSCILIWHSQTINTQDWHKAIESESIFSKSYLVSNNFGCLLI